MTVKHLQSVQRQQLNMAIQTDPSVVHKFKTGFVECAEEVNRYISQLEGVDPSVRQRLSNHLNNCATSLEQLGSMTNFNNGYRGHLGVSAINGLFGGAATQLINPLAAAAAAAATLNTQFPATLPQDLNNNNSSGSNHGNHPAATATATIQMGGVQLIPSRLPSGEFALIMPNTATNANATNNLLNNNNNNNNSSPFANSAFAGWNGTPNSHVVNPKPIPVAPTPISLSAAAATNFQRFSAFSKPQLQPPQQQQQQPALSVQLPAAHQKSLTAAVHGNISIKSFNTANPAVFHQPSTQHGLLHNSTAATSPPLSPISSICSSHTNDADDSLMHTSSDFIISRPTTPPSHDVLTTHILGHHQHSFTGVFSTPTPPSSADSSLSLSSSGAASSTHLQQQQVSSTSGSDTSANSSASLKRSRSDSSDSSEEPLSKKFHDGVEKEEAAEHNVSKEKCHMNKEGKDCESILEDRDSMWRPW